MKKKTLKSINQIVLIFLFLKRKNMKLEQVALLQKNNLLEMKIQNNKKQNFEDFNLLNILSKMKKVLQIVYKTAVNKI